MSWFAVPCYLESPAQDDSDEPLFEESIFLVEANSPEMAIERAAPLAKAGEDTFKNVYGEDVVWRFLRFGQPYEILRPVGDLEEIYSRFVGKAQLDALLSDDLF